MLGNTANRSHCFPQSGRPAPAVMLGQVWTRASPWRADRDAGTTPPAKLGPAFLARKFASARRSTQTLLSREASAGSALARPTVCRPRRQRVARSTERRGLLRSSESERDARHASSMSDEASDRARPTGRRLRRSARTAATPARPLAWCICAGEQAVRHEAHLLTGPSAVNASRAAASARCCESATPLSTIAAVSTGSSEKAWCGWSLTSTPRSGASRASHRPIGRIRARHTAEALLGVRGEWTAGAKTRAAPRAQGWLPGIGSLPPRGSCRPCPLQIRPRRFVADTIASRCPIAEHRGGDPSSPESAHGRRDPPGGADPAA
jgi:hypothetical protein